MLFGCVHHASAQWSTNGTNVFYNGGNVGIGTNAPTSILQIASPSGTNTLVNLNTISTSGASQLSFQENGVNKAYVEYVNSAFGTTSRQNNLEFYNASASGGIALHVNNSSTPGFLLTSSGSVGIGTTSPGKKLEILATDGEALRIYRNANNVGWGGEHEVLLQ